MEDRIKTLFYKGKRHLPLPTGPFTVACSDIMTSYLKFGVFVRIYYPSKNEGTLEHYLQWPLWVPHKQYVNGYASRVGLPAKFYRFIFQLAVGRLHIPAVWQAPIRPCEEKYPVVVFSHGLSGWRTTYSALCLELASYGFVVVAIEHRDHSASASFYKKQARMSAIGENPGAPLCDLDDLIENRNVTLSDPETVLEDIGPFCHANEWMLYQPVSGDEGAMRRKQLNHRAKECMEVMDMLDDLNKGRYLTNVLDSNFDFQMFKDKLDLSSSFVIGHSFGGATAILALALELRFKSGIFLDPWMLPFYEDQRCFPMIGQNFLCVLVKSFQNRQSFSLAKMLKETHKERARFYIVKDAEHRDLSDTPFVAKCSPSFLTRLGFRIDKFSALDLTTHLILQHLGQCLSKEFRCSSKQLELLQKRYLRPESRIDKYVV